MNPDDERFRIEARLYAAARDIEPVQVDISDGSYEELSGAYWAHEHASWRALSELLGIDPESDDGDIAEAITSLRADCDRLLTALTQANENTQHWMRQWAEGRAPDTQPAPAALAVLQEWGMAYGDEADPNDRVSSSEEMARSHFEYAQRAPHMNGRLFRREKSTGPWREVPAPTTTETEESQR